VIGTVESGAGDLVTDGVNGSVVPAADTDALVLADDRDFIATVRANAIRDRHRLSWSAYGEHWFRLLRASA